MDHAPFLKLTSQERKGGRMTYVSSVCVCRCGERFPTDGQLKAHIYDPLGPRPEVITVLQSVEPEGLRMAVDSRFSLVLTDRSAAAI